jgi:general secretion pathway protein A
MYERFFGLVDAPFRLTPDPRYLFLSAKHADALAHLRLGISESSGFVCITGDVGAGKTTLLRRFLTEVGPEVSTAYIFNPALSAVELLQTINAELGLPATSPSRKVLVDALNAHMLTLRQGGRRALVIIDEAQALELDVLEQLRLLSNLETTTEKLLRVVLVGQPQLRTVLQHPELIQLNQRITLRWHIGPLERGETADYVRHRLAIASRGQCGRVFTPNALRLVHRFSGGVPRLINMIAHRSMLAAFAAEERTVTARTVLRAHREIESVPLPARVSLRRNVWRPRLAAAAGLAAVIAAGGWYGRDSDGLARLLDRLPIREQAAAPRMASMLVAAAPEATSETPAPPAAEQTAAHSAVMEPAEIEARLAALSPEESAHAAFDAMLAAWRSEPLAPGEVDAPADFAESAGRRRLEHLELTGNVAMLRLLDVPAVLELQLLGEPRPRYATLVGLRDDGASLVLGDGPPVDVSRAFLAETWFGQAHVVWEDFEHLGPFTLRASASGSRVRRLQDLLERAGVYDGPQTGVFDDGTMGAVLDLQRSRYITVDGQVGRLTRLVLYAAAGGYPRPSLGESTSDTAVGQAGLPDDTRGAS